MADSPSPSLTKSVPSNLRICSSCSGPMRGHSRVDRKYVCPPREKLIETLHQLRDEGHHDFVASIARKHAIPISVSSIPLIDRIRQRRPTPFPFADELEDIKPKIEESVSSVTSNLRRMISRVIDDRRLSESPATSSSSDTTIPDTSSDGLPAVGPWNTQCRQQWSAPSQRASLVPTLLVGSDGRTIREGSRADPRTLREDSRPDALPHPYFPSPPPSESLEQFSIIHHQSDDRDYDGSGFHRVLRSVVASPAIMAIPVRPEDVPRVRETSARHGLHTSVLDVLPRSPPGSTALPRSFRNSSQPHPDDDDDRPIVVIGRDPAMAQRYVEMAQHGVIPGTVSHDQALGPRLITMSQFIIMMTVMVVLICSLFFTFFLWSAR